MTARTSDPARTGERPEARSGASLRAPRLARPFVVVFLLATVAAPTLVWEPWPLTSWRLFSHARTDLQTGWQATAVSDAGVEVSYPLGALPRGYRGFSFLMREFPDAPVERRDELCRTWLAGADEGIGVRARAVRIYRTERRLSRREGNRTLPPSRELAYVCTAEGARGAG